MTKKAYLGGLSLLILRTLINIKNIQIVLMIIRSHILIGVVFKGLLGHIAFTLLLSIMV